MKTHYDVIVVGGGVIGATSAWRLAQTGRSVLVLERGHIGCEASSAAAGMLGAQLEVGEPGPFYQLCLASRSLYQDFVDELLETTGIDAQLTHNGIYQLAYTEEEVAALQMRMSWQVVHGARAEWLDAETVAKAEPALAPSLGALYLPDDSNVNAPLLARALGVAVHQSCAVREGADVTDIQPKARGGYTVLTQTEEYAADAVVISAGAWSTRLLRPLAVPCSVEPVKGQLLSIRPRHGQKLTHTLFSRHIYLVPKRDGTVVVGATEERGAGYNRDVTVDAMATLLSEAKRIAPGLKDAIFQSSWTGLRPGSPNGTPWIGEVPGQPGLHVAAGHFRNGILLSPMTGKMMVHSLSGEPWPEVWGAFRVPESDLVKG